MSIVIIILIKISLNSHNNCYTNKFIVMMDDLILLVFFLR